MKKCFFLLMLVFFYNCKTIRCQDKIACKYFKEVYLRIENNYKNAKKNLPTTYHSTDYDFIYKLTGKQSDYEIEYIISYYPSKSNLKEWNLWYKKNKKDLYWDDLEKTVKVNKNEK